MRVFVHHSFEIKGFSLCVFSQSTADMDDCRLLSSISWLANTELALVKEIEHTPDNMGTKAL